MKQSETISLGEAIRHLLGEEPQMHERLLEHHALQALPTILGPVAQYVHHPEIRDGVLYLGTYSSAVRQALTTDRHSLICRINQAIGAELLREAVIR